MLDENKMYMTGAGMVSGRELNVARSLNDAVIAMLERKRKAAVKHSKKEKRAHP